MAPIKFAALALTIAAAANGVAGAQVGCDVLTDCKGSVTVALQSTCTATGFGPEGVKSFNIAAAGLKGQACLQCPGTGKVDTSTFPYFTCDGKALCGNVPGSTIITAPLKPNQAKCIWTNPDQALSCIGGCTPSEGSDTTAAPSGTSGPGATTAPGATTTPGATTVAPTSETTTAPANESTTAPANDATTAPSADNSTAEDSTTSPSTSAPATTAAPTSSGVALPASFVGAFAAVVASFLL